RRGTARIRALAEETLEIGGQSIPAKRLEVETGGMKSIAWVDGEGEVVRAETPVGLVVERLDPSTLATSERTAASRGDAGDFLDQTAIKPRGEKPRRGIRRLVATAAVPEGPVSIPSDGHQQVSADGRLEVIAQPAPGRAGDDWLRPDAFIQSDHPRMVAQAQAIIGDLETPAEKAVAIYEWVWREVEKVPVMSLPSALEVLDSKKGDCNEHTVLFAALARAVELPTGIAVGLVWSDELDGFYYHAWPEVLIDGEIHRFDPTLGQKQADATHIKLLEGGIASWPRLLGFLGQLELEILEIAE
ncbi:MAG: transglutaminase-like domain-containing protein, partial [Acidobacteriota bacterium]